jgi:hypothetical protein
LQVPFMAVANAFERATARNEEATYGRSLT